MTLEHELLALKDYRRAIELEPENAEHHLRCANALLRAKRLDEAQAAIARARALEPDAARLKELDEELARAVNGEQ